jgi:hypothetical protein
MPRQFPVTARVVKGRPGHQTGRGTNVRHKGRFPMSEQNSNNLGERPPNAIRDHAHMTPDDVRRVLSAFNKLRVYEPSAADDEVIRRTAALVLFERLRRLTAPIEDLALLNGVSRREYVALLDSCIYFAEDVSA